MGIFCGKAPLTDAWATTLNASNAISIFQDSDNELPEIVNHPLMDAFVEWDAGRTNYHNTTMLTTIWGYFLRERPDLYGEDGLEVLTTHLRGPRDQPSLSMGSITIYE